MKKMIILFFSACSLMACATFQSQPAFDWRGQNFDDYILKYGMPASQYVSSNGNIIYSFKETCEYDRMQEGETLVTVGENNLIQSISNPTKCPSYYESPAYEIDRRRKEIERERREHEEKLREQRNDISGELLNMGTELEQQAHLLGIESAAVYAEAKKRLG